jgi:hypothetical protein
MTGTTTLEELVTRFEDNEQVPAAVEQVTASLPKGLPAEVADTISNGIKTRLRRLEEA